jgi:hypothetical protein
MLPPHGAKKCISKGNTLAHFQSLSGPWKKFSISHALKQMGVDLAKVFDQALSNPTN